MLSSPEPVRREPGQLTAKVEGSACTVSRQPSFLGIFVFDLDSLPTNSDVLLIVSQYIKCLRTQDHQDRHGSV
jgi:hypothetical protein